MSFLGVESYQSQREQASSAALPGEYHVYHPMFSWIKKAQYDRKDLNFDNFDMYSDSHIVCHKMPRAIQFEASADIQFGALECLAAICGTPQVTTEKPQQGSTGYLYISVVFPQ